MIYSHYGNYYGTHQRPLNLLTGTGQNKSSSLTPQALQFTSFQNNSRYIRPKRLNSRGIPTKCILYTGRRLRHVSWGLSRYKTLTIHSHRNSYRDQRHKQPQMCKKFRPKRLNREEIHCRDIYALAREQTLKASIHVCVLTQRKGIMDIQNMILCHPNRTCKP